jgi:leucyl aminopeptidase
MAWNLSAKPGRPAGGDAQSLRAVFEMLEKRYR